jgi:hypothetical protein
MAEDTFDYELDQVMQKVIALEKEVKALKEPKDTEVLESKDGRFRVSLTVDNTGIFQASLQVKVDGTFKSAGERKLFAAHFDHQFKAWRVMFS